MKGNTSATKKNKVSVEVQCVSVSASVGTLRKNKVRVETVTNGVPLAFDDAREHSVSKPICFSMFLIARQEL